MMTVGAVDFGTVKLQEDSKRNNGSSDSAKMNFIVLQLACGWWNGYNGRIYYKQAEGSDGFCFCSSGKVRTVVRMCARNT